MITLEENCNFAASLSQSLYHLRKCQISSLLVYYFDRVKN